MTDDEQPLGSGTGPGSDPGADAGAAQPQAAGTARPTSRARRIGGARPAPRPGPVAPDDDGGPVDADDSGAVDADYESGPVDADEPARPRREAPVTGPDHAAAGATSGAPRWIPGLITLAAAAAAVVFLVLGAVVSHGVWWGTGNATAGERGAVLAAAKSCMATMNTYDYRKLDEAERAGLACTTGQLTDQYRTAMEKVIKPEAAKIQFTQSAQVLNAGIESVSPDGSQWTVLVFGQLTTTNSATAATPTPGAAASTAPSGAPPAGGAPDIGSNPPRLDLFSARAVMEKVGGRWLVANYQYAPSS